MISVPFYLLPLILSAPLPAAPPEAELGRAEELPTIAAKPVPDVLVYQAKPYLEMALEQIMIFDELATILGPVKDKLTAEAAVSSTVAIARRIEELAEKEKQLPVPSADVEGYVREKLVDIDAKKLSENTIGKIIELLTLIDPPCYGSTDLTKALNSLVESLIAD